MRPLQDLIGRTVSKSKRIPECTTADFTVELDRLGDLCFDQLAVGSSLDSSDMGSRLHISHEAVVLPATHFVFEPSRHTLSQLKLSLSIVHRYKTC
jgi:hypothetical protein